jgi:hypothetical protein
MKMDKLLEDQNTNGPVKLREKTTASLEISRLAVVKGYADLSTA